MCGQPNQKRTNTTQTTEKKQLEPQGGVRVGHAGGEGFGNKEEHDGSGPCP